MLALLSTCQPCAGVASTTVPSGQIPFYQTGCTALAHVMPGGSYGSQTVNCYTATAAHQVCTLLRPPHLDMCNSHSCLQSDVYSVALGIGFATLTMGMWVAAFELSRGTHLFKAP